MTESKPDVSKCDRCGKEFPPHNMGSDWDKFLADVVRKDKNTKIICVECGDKARGRGPVKFMDDYSYSPRDPFNPKGEWVERIGGKIVEGDRDTDSE